MEQDLRQTIESYGQERVLRFWDELTETGKKRLSGQLERLDWEELASLIKSHVLTKPEVDVPEYLEPAPYFPIKPEDESQRKLYEKAVEAGIKLLSEGKVAALTVAGGQGTRLGYDGPKGTFPITPLREKTLFQYFSEALDRASAKHSARIPWHIMTSEMNHAATVDFFKENNYFGRSVSDIHFFTQGVMPAVDYEGKLLLGAKDSLALSPDGHGGTLLALRKSGVLDEMREDGVDHISYFQVDNPLVTVVDPLFVGLHHLEGAEMSARMLPKTGPFEKLGNFCLADGRLRIIEYSDMPDELAEKREDDGRLSFIAGSPAIHMISRDFVEELTRSGRLNLPWHRADKKVPYVNEKGDLVEPTEPNAVKLETFIFDALPMAERTVVLEAAREDEFAPTKNRTGVDSVESCQAMLMDRDARWLEAAGVTVPHDEQGRVLCRVELSPKTFIDQADVSEWIKENKLGDLKPGEERYIE